MRRFYCPCGGGTKKATVITSYDTLGIHLAVNAVWFIRSLLLAELNVETMREGTTLRLVTAISLELRDFWRSTSLFKPHSFFSHT